MMADLFESLNQLLEAGFITQEEYDDKKKSMLRLTAFVSRVFPV